MSPHLTIDMNRFIKHLSLLKYVLIFSVLCSIYDLEISLIVNYCKFEKIY